MPAVKRKQVACNTFLKSDYRLDIRVLTFSAFNAPRHVQPAPDAKAISNQLSPCLPPLSVFRACRVIYFFFELIAMAVALQ